MAAIVVTQGLDRTLINTSHTATWDTNRYVRTMSIDDQASAFLSTDQDLDRAGGLTVTNEYDAAFDATPAAPTAQVVSHTMTVPTGSGNFTVRRIALHDDTAANVTTSSNTLHSGVDGQTLAKTSDFTLTPTLTLSAADAS